MSLGPVESTRGLSQPVNVPVGVQATALQVRNYAGLAGHGHAGVGAFKSGCGILGVRGMAQGVMLTPHAVGKFRNPGAGWGFHLLSPGTNGGLLGNPVWP